MKQYGLTVGLIIGFALLFKLTTFAYFSLFGPAEIEQTDDYEINYSNELNELADQFDRKKLNVEDLIDALASDDVNVSTNAVLMLSLVPKTLKDRVPEFLEKWVDADAHGKHSYRSVIRNMGVWAIPELLNVLNQADEQNRRFHDVSMEIFGTMSVCDGLSSKEMLEDIRKSIRPELAELDDLPSNIKKTHGSSRELLMRQELCNNYNRATSGTFNLKRALLTPQKVWYKLLSAVEQIDHNHDGVLNRNGLVGFTPFVTKLGPEIIPDMLTLKRYKEIKPKLFSKFLKPWRQIIYSYRNEAVPYLKAYCCDPEIKNEADKILDKIKGNELKPMKK